MSKINVLAGDFQKGKQSSFQNDTFYLANGENTEEIFPEMVENVEFANEENVKRLGRTVTWGLVGGALLGPVGLLGGLVVGGRGTDVTFIAKLKDGRKFLATTDSKTFTKIQAATF